MPEAGYVRAAEDQMIDDRTFQCLGGYGQAAGGMAVGDAWSRIAAWMVVRQDYACAFVDRSIANDRADRQARLATVALVA